jgi:hypothetical protein
VRKVERQVRLGEIDGPLESDDRPLLPRDRRPVDAA